LEFEKRITEESDEQMDSEVDPSSDDSLEELESTNQKENKV